MSLIFNHLEIIYNENLLRLIFLTGVTFVFIEMFNQSNTKL